MFITKAMGKWMELITLLPDDRTQPSGTLLSRNACSRSVVCDVVAVIERRWPQHNEGTDYGTCLPWTAIFVAHIPQAKVEPERDAKAYVIRVYVRTAKWNGLVLKGSHWRGSSNELRNQPVTNNPHELCVFNPGDAVFIISKHRRSQLLVLNMTEFILMRAI